MKILQDVYMQLLACPTVPPECGGIIGSENGRIITHLMFDRCLDVNEGIVYIPNTQFLNKTIKEWNACGIEFLGIFHTHAPQWPALSNGDKVYIVDILSAMPPDIQFLYFPLIFKKKKMKNYIAKRNGKAVNIVDDDIEIIKKEEETQNERNK